MEYMNNKAQGALTLVGIVIAFLGLLLLIITIVLKRGITPFIIGAVLLLLGILIGTLHK